MRHVGSVLHHLVVAGYLLGAGAFSPVACVRPGRSRRATWRPGVAAFTAKNL